MSDAMMSGFGNEHATEAVPGALPVGRNSPQRPAFGLYAEQLSGTAFTAPRSENRRAWLYRMRPSAMHAPFTPLAHPTLRGAPFDEAPTPPNRLRWSPRPMPTEPTDWLEGLYTLAGNGDPTARHGIAVHLYAANRSMEDTVFSSADGELVFVPQAGDVEVVTEMGRLSLTPGEIGVVPRGVRFRVEVDGEASGYVGENYGALLRLPDLGPIGANGLANPRDFLSPPAWFEDVERPTRWVQSFAGRTWETTLDHSPLDVVAWHGNLAPYEYDLRRFNTINTVSYDHPDPSIFTVLTSPSDTPGTANCDFVIFPPRWMVAEDTFRPPWFHRNVMSELMGLVYGVYDAKADGFAPGGASLHNCMSGHGPDQATHAAATEAELAPHKIEQTLAFMFESCWVIRPTKQALDAPTLQGGYDACWDDFEKARLP